MIFWKLLSFFQRFWCVALSMYWCFWIPPVRYLWEINKRSCLPFVCSHTSWNAYHLICCSFTKLEVKYSLAMTLQLLPTEDKNLICMYDTMWRQKQWNIYSRIYICIILISLKQVCLCYITKITYYLRALISINGRNKFNYYIIELILLNLAATMYMTPM